MTKATVEPERGAIEAALAAGLFLVPLLIHALALILA
jgi:hypothetical protein